MRKRIFKIQVILFALLAFSFLPLRQAGAQTELDCSTAPVEKMGCKQLTPKPGENPCPVEYVPCDAGYCQGRCLEAKQAVAAGHSRGCCCKVGDNKREIRLGRLMDKTEWLADQIIKESEALIRAAEAEISASRSLHSASGECKAETCDNQCVTVSVCTGCECSGCEPDEGRPPPGQCEQGEEDEMECSPVVPPPGCWQEAVLPQTFTKTYGTLVPTAFASGCTPKEGPNNLEVEVEGATVHLSWDGYPFDCPDQCLCLPQEPQFLVEWRRYNPASGTAGPWNQSGWHLDEEAEIKPPDPDKVYQWRVAQIHAEARAAVYSEKSTFELAPVEPPGNPSNFQATQIGDCQVRLTWRMGDLNCPPSFAYCFEEPRFKVRFRKEGDSWTYGDWTREEEAVITFSQPGTDYEWQVKQSNGYRETDWMPQPPPPPPAPATFTTETAEPNVSEVRFDTGKHSITVSATGTDTGCNPDCAPCDPTVCEGDIEYKFSVLTNSAAVKELGGPVHLASYDEEDKDGWIESSSFTFDCNSSCTNLKTGERGIPCQIFSNTDYSVYINIKNGCGVESGNAQKGRVRTEWEEDCRYRGLCPAGKTRAPDNCGFFGGVNGCVENRNACNGTVMPDPPNCGGECAAQGDLCCAQTAGCVESCERPAYECEYCVGNCEDMGKTCCCNIDPAQFQTCQDLTGECTPNRPNCCCDNVYSGCYDEAGGCFGNPCPGNIPALVQTIIKKLHEIETHKKNIDELYDRMEEEIPPALKTVKNRLEKCFEEAGIEKAGARGEAGMIELLDCQQVIARHQAIHTYLPKVGTGFQKGEGLQTEPFLGACWGNTYCAAETQAAHRENREPNLPWDSPCAEDFYCCTWK